MDNRTRTLTELEKTSISLSSLNAVVGLDGFVDKIMSIVDKRSGQGENFTAVQTIADLGARISAAAGKSANIELFPRYDKLGGNGPIMANALLSAGANVRYIGALGKAGIHPVLADFAKKVDAVSVADPGITQALEFNDGKIMLGTMAGLDDVTYNALVAAIGEGKLLDMFARANLVALVNWTMIPNMTEVFISLLEKVLPNLPPSETPRHYFFDLADPRKRSDGDIKQVLKTIARFCNFGQVTLGLNLAEGQQIDEILGFSPVHNDPEGLQEMATRIRREVGVHTVVVHPVDGAACATKDDSWYVRGPYCRNPKITTGAGDHFNAGFMAGKLLGLSPEACLTVAISFSGHYVRTAESPSMSNVDSFIRNHWE